MKKNESRLNKKVPDDLLNVQASSDIGTDLKTVSLLQEKLIRQSELLSAFTKYSIELSGTPFKEIHQYIVDSFKQIFKIRSAWISSFDERSSDLVVEASTATSEESNLFYKVLGMPVKGYRTPVSAESYKMMVERDFVVYNSIYDISFGHIPRPVAKTVDKIFDLGWIDGIALKEHDTLFGSMVVAGFKNQEQIDSNLLKIFTDITVNAIKRKEIENKLSLSEDRFRKAFETSPDAVNINRLKDGMYVSVNKGFTRITGYTPEEVVGKTSIELDIWVDKESRETLVKRIYEHGEVHNLLARFRMKNGDVRHAIMSASVIELDGQMHILNITRDVDERIKAEELVKKSEEKYRLLAENISDVIWVLDPETMYFKYISPSVEKLRGYTAEEVMSQSVTAALTPEGTRWIVESTRQRAAAVEARLEPQGLYSVNEVEQPCKDGSTVWTEVVTSFYLNNETGKAEVLGVTRDITERRKNEQALKQSEVFFKDIFESVNVGLVYATPEGTVLEINHALEEMIGMSKSTVLGRNIIDVAREYLDEENFLKLLPLLESAMRNDVVKSAVIKFRDKYIEILGSSNEKSNRITGIFYDITDKVKKEDEIHKIGQHYRALIEKAPDGIILLNNQGHIKYASPSARKLFGYSPDEQIPTDPAKMTHPDDVQDVLKSLYILLSDPSFIPTLMYRFMTKNGDWLWIESTFTNLLNDPSVESIVINFRNITDRKIVEDEINKLNITLEERVKERTAQLEDVNKELQAFAYSVSHDLRAPLRAIDGFSRYLEDDYRKQLDEEGVRMLGLIRSNTHKMDKLIVNLLSLSKVTRAEHKKSAIDMTKVAMSMYNEVISSEVQSGIKLKIGDLPDCVADSTLIKQVWINLISNAFKFSSHNKSPEIQINGYSEKGFNIYYVKDNGVGFNPDYAFKLFGVFQRLHKNDEFEGTGVGLAIVQRIVHRHGGNVWAEGKEGEGATFYFSIPIVETHTV
jgi:PAS domain S-box-containing protein